MRPAAPGPGTRAPMPLKAAESAGLGSDCAGTGSQPLDAWRLRGATWSRVSDTIAEEVPVALQYNGISHAVMLATPCDLEDFAVGFSLTEGIVESRADIHDLEIEPSEGGVTVVLRIASARFEALKQRRRSMAGRTGCGLCGVESLEQAIGPTPLVAGGARSIRIAPTAVLAAVQALRTHQPLHDDTGATHAAGFAEIDGRLVCVREDVGRHNALDKLIGALARAGTPRERGFAVVTSRASHEMVSKTARAGIPLLAAVSGVTRLAAETAQEAGLCLAGFVRGSDLTVYAHVERIEHDPVDDRPRATARPEAAHGR
jgi:FdhD protein